MHRSIPLFVAAVTCLVGSLAPRAQAQDPAQDRMTLHGEFARGRVKVTQQGSIYSLRYTGLDETIEYQIDVNHNDVKGGMVRVYEVQSDSFPINQCGVTFINAAGNQYVPQNFTSVSTLSNHFKTSDSVVIEYTDNVPTSGVHHRRHTLRLVGKVLSVTIEDIDQIDTYLNNYAGVMTGPTAGTDDPRIIEMQGALGTPIVMFQNGAQHFFLGNVLDMFQSNAADWLQADLANVTKTATTIDFCMNTAGRYYRNSQGKNSGPLKDTLRVCVSKFAHDVMLKPTQKPSPYRSLIDHRPVVMLQGGVTTWNQYKTHLAQFADWGMDDIAAYAFSFWTTSADDPPVNYNLGPDWYPATDPGNFASFVSAARAQGALLGVYTSFAVMPTSALPSVYSTAHIAKKDNGQFKISPHTGVPLISATAGGIHAQREADFLRQNYGVNMAYLDIQTYASPSRGADGDHVDQMATSGWAHSLRQALLDQKTWMRATQDKLQGPLLGEGSIATWASNMEWLWAGYCDSVQRCINTNRGLDASHMPANDPKSPTKWPVIPEFELRTMKPLQCNHGNGFYNRFFSKSDVGMVDSSGQPIIPLTEAMFDRYRIYEITYGHTAFFTTSGPFNPIGQGGNSMTFASMIKEYYLMKALQTRYMRGGVEEIEYLYNGTLQPFEAIIGQTETTDTFRDARLHLAYDNRLEIYLNHSTTPWQVTAQGVAYSIPQDGFVAFQPSTSFVAFSAAAPGTNGNRIDYCFAPGEYEFFDGRGVVNGYGGINTGGSKLLRVENFVHGIEVAEQSNGSIQVIPGAAPQCTRVEIVGPGQILPGDRRAVRAIANYSNGAFRDVTTVVQWSSSNPAKATINQGGALIGVASGNTNLTTSAFEGVQPSPKSVTVQ